MKDYIKDLKQCVKRLFHAEDMLDLYLSSNGQEKAFFKSLDLNGITQDYKHPILDYDNSERECFSFICGAPLQLPEDFTHYSPLSVRVMITYQRNRLRMIAGMTENSRWLGKKNYLHYIPFKMRYLTGRLVD